MGSRSGRSGPNFRGRSRASGPGWLRRIWRGVQALVILGLLGFMALALYFQLGGVWRVAALAGLTLAAAGLAALWANARLGLMWLAALLLCLAFALWYSTIRPGTNPNWAPEVARGVTGTIGPDTVTLHNVRDFTWTSPTEFTPRWQDQTYRLADLRSMDVISSVWASPAIAHTLVSFGFADGRHVVFSAEIRRRQDQAYSSIAGFFRAFDLVLIAAEERDIIYLRTDARREWVSVFPLQIAPDQMQAAFLTFVGLGNDLAENPRFYNTLTTNCTTVVWRLARAVSPGLPLDWRVLVSGHLPEYLHDLGVLAPGLPINETLARARRAPLGPDAGDSVAFSRRLRAEPAPVPQISPSDESSGSPLP